MMCVARPHMSCEVKDESYGHEESKLTKGQLRKLNALQKSVGQVLGKEVFAKWLAQQAQASASMVDPVAVKIEEVLAVFRQR